MIFKAYECDFGVKVDGSPYEFDEVLSLVGEDNKRKRLTRGANAKNKTGITYTEGLKDPDRWTVTIANMSPDIKALLDRVHENEVRVDVYCISRKDGSSKMAKNAILSNKPQQLQLDESPESMNVILEFESFDVSENHKS